MRGRDRGRQRPDELLTLLRQAGARILATVRGTPGLLLFSLLLGVALWVFVTEEENPTRTDIFPAPISVRAVNVGQSLAVANQLEFIDVRIAAPEDRWEQLTSDNFRAFVDLNGLEAREQNVPVRVEVPGISGVRVVETIPVDRPSRSASSPDSRSSSDTRLASSRWSSMKSMRWRPRAEPPTKRRPFGVAMMS